MTEYHNAKRDLTDKEEELIRNFLESKNCKVCGNKLRNRQKNFCSTICNNKNTRKERDLKRKIDNEKMRKDYEFLYPKNIKTSSTDKKTDVPLNKIMLSILDRTTFFSRLKVAGLSEKKYISIKRNSPFMSNKKSTQVVRSISLNEIEIALDFYNNRF